jgi:hypothetical protein
MFRQAIYMIGDSWHFHDNDYNRNVASTFLLHQLKLCQLFNLTSHMKVYNATLSPEQLAHEFQRLKAARLMGERDVAIKVLGVQTADNTDIQERITVLNNGTATAITEGVSEFADADGGASSVPGVTRNEALWIHPRDPEKETEQQALNSLWHIDKRPMLEEEVSNNMSGTFIQEIADGPNEERAAASSAGSTAIWLAEGTTLNDALTSRDALETIAVHRMAVDADIALEKARLIHESQTARRKAFTSDAPSIGEQAA